MTSCNKPDFNRHEIDKFVQQADKTDNLKQVCGVVAVSITWDKYLRKEFVRNCSFFI